MPRNALTEKTQGQSADPANRPEVQYLGCRRPLFQPLGWGAVDAKRGPIFFARFSGQWLEVWKDIEEGNWTGPATLVFSDDPVGVLRKLWERAERGEPLFPRRKQQARRRLRSRSQQNT